LFKKKKYHKYSDEELVEKIQQEQDMYCVGVLYERYGHLVFGLALKYLKNRNDAEDLTAHVFESLFNKLQKHNVQHFKSWLYMLSKNECLMILRKQNPQGDYDLTFIQDEEVSGKFEEKEIKLELLEEKIGFLKDEQQQCVRLFYLEEKSYQQVSDELKLPLSKVKSAIQNGKRNLKILLEQHHEFK
jgi:RNA polymerase sigma-70 factor (ECF subfamily)